MATRLVTAVRDSVMVKARPVQTTTTKAELLASRLQGIRVQIKELEARKDDLGARLLREVKAHGIKDTKGNVSMENLSVTLKVIASVNRNIDEKRLLAAGVKPTIIRNATIETPYEYVGVYEKKGVGTDA